MLLFNICVLIGAVLTPPSLRWLYSTCIALLCLYQIFRKDWLGLFIVTISLVALISSNIWQERSKSEITEQWYWDVEQHCAWTPRFTQDFYILLKTPQGNHKADLCQASKPLDRVPISLHHAHLFGDYREHQAFVKGVDALLYLPQASQPAPVLTQLDQYASWRFAYSIIKGDRSQWDERDRWLINYLGITHLFVVSGLHVGFVCLLALLCSRMLWRCSALIQYYVPSRAWLNGLLAAPLCFLYAGWSGFGEPAIRAAVMALVFLSVSALHHKVSLLNVLSLCAWLMLLQWPGRALDPSFWLSFAFVLLIGLLMSRVQRFGRLLWLQCLMSLFALLLTLGWQSSLSTLTVLVNLVLIPFVAFVWFPVALVSLLEFTCCHSTLLYAQLDRLLLWVYRRVEDPLYQVAAIQPNEDVTALVKLCLIGLAFWGVYWLPSRRAMGFMIMLLSAAILTPLPKTWQMQWYQDRFEVLYWQPSAHDVPVFSVPKMLSLNGLNIALNPSKDAIAEHALQDNWHLALLGDAKQADLLRAMQVQVLTMRQGERLSFYRDGAVWQVQSSDCYHLLNLVKTVACEHAEWLESVLNYPQFDTGGLGARAF
ncbi:ComEC family competence protein [Marinomonas aquimarina]|uniref:ComEC family competence protein n=1 Tax=Marinomonas aquimarina TaxID=295068 RepID=A0A1A8TGU9_9GAMM|nr:ComEC/Rec2 family competence protein [Marinomonas aquimarina]SBS31839.1 ComEC family competence protein [Marinomonas aquimarina]